MSCDDLKETVRKPNRKCSKNKLNLNNENLCFSYDSLSRTPQQPVDIDPCAPGSGGAQVQAVPVRSVQKLRQSIQQIQCNLMN